MKTVIKIVGLMALFLGGNFLLNAWQGTGMSTVVANQIAIDTVNGGNVEFVTAHSWMFIQQYFAFAWAMLMLGISFLVLKGDIKEIFSPKVVPLLLVCLIPFLGSCKKYQVPVYKEISNNETAFVVPLEGDTQNQAKFNSKENLEKLKVATKRIEIPTRWNKEGRHSSDGSWIPTVTVIVVDRSPVTRNWEAIAKGEDTAIWVESSDSVGFSMGFNCTAFIREEDTATFLYWYSSGSLSKVMDNEIRGMIQQIAAEECAKDPLDLLRTKKNEVATAVRNGIIPFFKERGITVTTVGMFGGMTYENAAIQNSIDAVFVAQQEKNVALAKFDAQKKENERIILASEGLAKQRQVESEAEAKAITALTQAVAQGGSNYLQLKSLEVQGKQIEKWDGKLPAVTSGALPLLDAAKFIK